MHMATWLLVALALLHFPSSAHSQASLPHGNWHRVPSDLALIDNRYGEQYLYLYSFCTSFPSALELIAEEAIYMQVLGLASSLQFVAFDWSAGAPGLDYVPPASSLHQPTLVVPLRTEYTSQSGWNPLAEDLREVSGLILSRWPLERVDLFLSQSIAASSRGECPMLASLAHPPCTPAEEKTAQRVECAPEYPVDCEGFPSTVPCPFQQEETYSEMEERSSTTITESTIHPWIALVGFVPVIMISLAVFVLLRLDRLQRQQHLFPDEGVPYVDELHVITHGDDESDDDESALLPGEGLPV